MGEPAGEQCLLQGALERLRSFRLAGHRSSDELEGNQPAQPAVHGGEDGTAGTTTQQVADLVAAGDERFIHARHPATVPGQTGAE